MTKKKDKVPTLEIDMYKACLNCHEMGATESGQCIKCITASLKTDKVIGYLTLQKAKAELCAMIDEYHDEIDKAYIKADGDLTVALGLKMAGTRMAGEVELTVSINFVESRIKHAVKLTINEKQMKIPGVK